ncbi:hypothetical protein PU580_001634 [Salmonella enterica]|uniref:hypothetical protein n=1 Tax=Salmonella enterica TaxID=28901 RepID=UPI00159249DC|nr:hypothetical protein [Salmonella enterica]EFU5990713.1 hypothetical protein [Salmonella enterica subsp. enterica serovar Brandenburg]EHP2316785.1 hypothetical protein [Salmonella enterica subsp. enterica serovar Panama]EFT3427964.1 hypothetical protein [Salmonella enterica]EFT4015630.1 hypothetical protein [Salmonella enterica]EFU2894062.1 hypothetical protein [Salmonella enterica]
MLKLFVDYVSVGVLSTTIDFMTFGAVFSLIGLKRAIPNVLSPCVASTFRFSSTPILHLSGKQRQVGVWHFSLKNNKTHCQFVIKTNTNHGC